MSIKHSSGGIIREPARLIYTKSINSFKNVLLIDSGVKDYKIFVSSVNADTFPIVYSKTSTKTELLELLGGKFTTIDRIALCFTGGSGRSKKFLDNKSFFDSENVEALINIIKSFSVKNIDYLACNTLKNKDWQNYYDCLTKETGVIVGASSDKTGNIKYGGDWIMENTGEDINPLYFTKSIEYYSYLLDTFPVWAETGDGPDGLVTYGDYLYVANFYDYTISKINLSDPSENIVWAETGVGPSGLVIDNSYLYVANFYDDTISKINLSNPNDNIIWAETDNKPNGLVTYGDYLYVTNSDDNNISKINLSDPSENIIWAETGDSSYALAIYNGYLYVSNSNDNNISKISLSDPNDNIIWAETGVGPYGLAIYNGYLYVANEGDDNISKINLSNPSDNTVWAQTGLFPWSLAIDNGYLYVSNSDDNTISRFELPITPTMVGYKIIRNTKPTKYIK
jgi:DNA-binding beta-propeller fold protein YncE